MYQLGNLMPVKVVRVGLRQRLRDPQALEPCRPPLCTSSPSWSIASGIIASSCPPENSPSGPAGIRNGQGQGQGQACGPRAACTVAGTGLHGLASGLRRTKMVDFRDAGA